MPTTPVTTDDKLVQYLLEAHAMEQALVRTLEAHIAMTPSGAYRSLLERHLRETRDHAERISRRLADLGRNPTFAESLYGVGQWVAGQLIALGKTPLDLLRGGSAEEKLLKNAKDEAASEALEIATYDAIERLARIAGDDLTARLAADHRADEERMLAALREQLPRLTAAVVGAEVEAASPAAARRTAATPRTARRRAARRRATRSRAARRQPVGAGAR